MTVKNRRVFELRLGKLGLTLFIGGMSLLLFSFFLLGVVVGKNMEAYPERYSTGIAEFIDSRLFTALPQTGTTALPETDPGRIEDVQGRDVEIAPAGEESPAGNKEAVAPESRRVAEKNKAPEADAEQSLPAAGALQPSAAVSSGIPVGMHRSAQEVKPSGDSKAAPGGKAVEMHRAPLVAEKEAAEKKAVPAPEGKAPVDAGVKKAPAAEAVPPPKGRYEIQAAAYRERAQAEQLVKKFADTGFPSQVVVKEIPGKGQWYRVILGGFENREKAQAAADQLTGKVQGLKCVIRPAAK